MDADLQEKIREFLRDAQRMGVKINDERLIQQMADLAGAITGESKDRDDLIKAMRDRAGIVRRDNQAFKSLESDLGNLSDATQDRRQAEKDAAADIRGVMKERVDAERAAKERLQDDAERQSRLMQRQFVEMQSLSYWLHKVAGDNVALHIVMDQVINVLDGVGDVGRGLASFTMGLAQGSNQFSQLNVVIDAMASAVSKAAAAIPVLGAAASAAASVSKLMIDQMQRSIDAFQKVSASGALASDGMSGFRERQIESGLTLEAYTRIVSENSQTLAMFGGSVADGSRLVSRSLRDLTQTGAGDALRNLGFTAEDMGDLQQDYLQRQIRLGVGQNLTQQQLTESTVRYGRELDIVAKLTGANRKELQKAQESALSEQRFRAKMDELAQTRGKEFTDNLNLLQATIAQQAPGLAQGFRDIIAAGGAVTTDAARQAMTLTGGQIQNIAREALDGRPIEESLQKLSAAAGEGTERFRGVAQFADLSGVIGDYAQASNFAKLSMNDLVDTANQLRSGQDQQAQGSDALTQAAVSAQKSLEGMSREIEDLAMKALPTAAETVNQFTDIMKLAIDKAAEFTGTESGGGSGGGLEKAAAAGGAYLGGKTGMAIGTMIAPGVGTAAGGAIGAVLGGLAGYFGMGGSFGFGGPDAVKPEDYIDFTGGTGSREHFAKLDPKVGEAFLNMARDYNQLTGKKLQINSAFRSPEEQAAVNSGTNPRAAPGMSLHQQGRALDIQSEQVRELMSNNLLGKYGFKNLEGDPPHIYMRKGGIADGPDSGYPATLHGTEAVVPLPNGRSIPVELQLPDLQKEFQLLDFDTAMPSQQDLQHIKQSFLDVLPRTQDLQHIKQSFLDVLPDRGQMLDVFDLSKLDTGSFVRDSDTAPTMPAALTLSDLRDFVKKDSGDVDSPDTVPAPQPMSLDITPLQRSMQDQLDLMTAQISRLDQLISAMRSQNSISSKMLQVAQA